MSDTMRVRATLPGFYDIKGDGHPVEIKPGQEFDVPAGHKPARWFKPVPAAPSVPPRDAKAPDKSKA